MHGLVNPDQKTKVWLGSQTSIWKTMCSFTGQKSAPKCVSSAKRASMTDAERKSAQRRRDDADPNQAQKSGAAKPTYVSTDPKKKKVSEAMNFSKFKSRWMLKEILIRVCG